MRHAKIVIYGHPNVGKSVIFNQLTGLSAIVSNYPGTTVEVYRGRIETEDLHITVIDAPGTYSMVPANLAEGVARKIIFEEKPDLIINVVDATSLKRHLYLTLELIELGIPTILAVNQVDRAENKGIHVDREKLEQMLNIPVVFTVATEGKGIQQLLTTALEIIKEQTKPAPPELPARIDSVLSEIEKKIKGQLPKEKQQFSRSVAEYIALEDEEFRHMLYLIPENLRGKLKSLGEDLIQTRAKTAASIGALVIGQHPERITLHKKIDIYLVHPIFGIAIMAALTFAVTWGALMIIHAVGHLIPFSLYSNFYDPVVRGIVDSMFPEGFIHNILVGDKPGIYSSLGVLTTGVFFVFFMILPAMLVLYLVLGFLEDVGFLPRLAIPFNKPMKKIGTCGEAVCPLLSGTGCSIVGVLATRTLKTDKARFIASLLQVFGIPCMAQEVMIWRLLGKFGPIYVLLLYLLLLVTLITVGSILNVLIRGEEEKLLLELPVWRKPQLANVLKKTYVRIKGFVFKGAPLVMVGVVMVNVLYYVGVIQAIAGFFSPVICGWFNLPDEIVGALIVGLLRKDVAVGVLGAAESLTAMQALTAISVITLYFPCIGSLLIVAQEFGAKKLALMITIMALTAITVGGLLGLISTLI